MSRRPQHREIVIDRELDKKRQLNINLAKILMTIAMYLFFAAMLLEYFSPIISLKTLSIVTALHAFFFLWKSQRYQE